TVRGTVSRRPPCPRRRDPRPEHSVGGRAASQSAWSAVCSLLPRRSLANPGERSGLTSAPMKVTQIGPAACRSYVVSCERSRRALLVDPLAEDVHRTLEGLDREGLELAMVLDTH